MFCDSACASYPQAPWHSRVISSNVLSSVADVSLQRLQPICWDQSVERYHFKPATHLLGSKCGKVSLQACNPSAGVKVWKGIAFRGPVVLVVAAIVVAVVVVVAVVGCNSQLKVGGNNLPPKAAGGNNLPPQFWRQQSATKINNLPPKRWRQQSATKKLAATICHQKVGGNNLPPESLRQQSTSWQQQV